MLYADQTMPATLVQEWNVRSLIKFVKHYFFPSTSVSKAHWFRGSQRSWNRHSAYLLSVREAKLARYE